MFTKRTALLFAIDEYDNYAPLSCVRRDIEGDAQRPGLRTVLSEGLKKHSFAPVTALCGRLPAATVQELIQRTIKDLKDAGADSEDTLLFLYFSGHGAAIEVEAPEDQFLIATSDTELDNPARGIRFPWLFKQILQLRSAVVCCIDCCYGGKAVNGAEHYARSSGKHNLAIFASCAADEESFVEKDHSQSRFTHFLIESLLGREPVSSHLREVTTSSLASALRTRFQSAEQTPTAWTGDTSILLSRPHAPMAWIGYPIARYFQERFRRDSTRALQRAIDGFGPGLSPS